MGFNALGAFSLRIKASCHTAIPAYKTIGSVGADLRFMPIHPSIAAVIDPGETHLLPTGVCIELEEGFEAQVRPRSSISLRGILVHVGTIDVDYRGEIGVIVTNVGKERVNLSAGERIAQLVIAPVVRAQFEAVAELSATERGTGGFGSTGR